MRIIKGVPDITVNNEFEIKSVQQFSESKDKVVLRTAEYIPQFVRGYVCDMMLKFPVCDREGAMSEPYYAPIKNLVLVHVIKTVEIDEFSQFEYVFYK